MVRPGEVLIANAYSLVSAGTEKMLRDLARKSLLGKARERPDHVRRVLEKMRNEGLFNTIKQVRTKLDEPMTMGYCSAGIVIACGDGVQQFKPGDRVASNGHHAELVSVPKNLCARAADNVPLDHAAFAVLGSIALQGVRLSKCTLGETVLVIGLGLVGQMAVAFLKAAGCRVVGADLDTAKCELAKQMGADEAWPNVSASDIEQRTGGLGVDAVVIAASTQSNDPIELAAAAVRKRGRIVLVGVVGLELDRRPFYAKEAEFVVSCSYGPGRYDPSYEQHGRDYPAPYVRWTEQRNIQAVLDMMATGKLDVAPLISHRFTLERATEAYDLISSGSEPYVGIVIEYPGISYHGVQRQIQLKAAATPGKIPIGVLGAGNFARMVLLPAIRSQSLLHLHTLCSAKGTSAVQAGTLHGFESAATDEEEVYANPSIQAVFVLTQHNQHAGQVLRAIESDKHVFVEKPLCLNVDHLKRIETALLAKGDQAPCVMVGFNRRFSPAAKQVKEFFAGIAAPRTVSIRFNAGEIPPDTWIQDPDVGGGRIIGEACHAIDLATFLLNSPPVRVYAESIGGPSSPVITDDQSFLTLRHADGSISQIAYLAGGDKAFPKERIEMFGGGQIAVIDDFREVVTCKSGRTKKHRYPQQNKGHQAEIVAFVQMLAQGGDSPISWAELRSVTLASILAVRSLREGVPFQVF
jgi:predicted dehydrogenase